MQHFAHVLVEPKLNIFLTCLYQQSLIICVLSLFNFILVEIESDHVVRVFASLYSDSLYISMIYKTAQNENWLHKRHCCSFISISKQICTFSMNQISKHR